MFRAKPLSIIFIVTLVIVAIILLFVHRSSHANDAQQFTCEYQLQQYNQKHPTAMLQVSDLKHFVCDCGTRMGYAVYEYDANSFTVMCPGGCTTRTIPTLHHIACQHVPQNWSPYAGGGRAVCNTDAAGTHQGAEGCQIDYY